MLTEGNWVIGKWVTDKINGGEWLEIKNEEGVLIAMVRQSREDAELIIKLKDMSSNTEVAIEPIYDYLNEFGWQKNSDIWEKNVAGYNSYAMTWDGALLIECNQLKEYSEMLCQELLQANNDIRKLKKDYGELADERDDLKEQSAAKNRGIFNG